MLYHDYSDKQMSTVCVLIKSAYFDVNEVHKHYIKPINDVFDGRFSACSLQYNSNNKITASQALTYLKQTLPVLVNQGIEYLLVADATYFKVLTGKTKAEQYYGYVLPCHIKDFTHINVVLAPNYGQFLYNPNSMDKLDLALQTLTEHYTGTYVPRGDIVKTSHYPTTDREITLALANLHQHTVLACDIETTGLELGSELFSIAFAYNQHEGVAFKVSNKQELKEFFERYRGTLIFHNATFDIKQIIYNCFMKHSADYKGMIHGLHTMCSNIHDTKIIAYLATNSTAGNKLGLKDLSHEFTGNYAIDVKDVTQHDIDTVLEYNLKDTLATFYVYNKYMPIMLKDNQESIYKSIMLPSIKTIVQIELCGMPIDIQQVYKTKKQLQDIADTALAVVMNSPDVKTAEFELRYIELQRINTKLKTKQHTMDKVASYTFNPNSVQHLSHLLYETIGLPVLDYTDSKQPATGAKSIQKLMNHTNDESVITLLNALLTYSSAQKVLSTFIPAFENAKPRAGWHYLHGNFNLGGTLSNRLSSSKPNMQNIPSGSEYGKLIKQCFTPDNNWLFVGADFSSLEARINALLTNDENKLMVYTQNLDSHSFNAFGFWKDEMPDITDTVDSINSIKYKYPEIRQRAKSPVFALQYSGTYHTLMNNCGFTEQEAKQIEASYHELYKQSDDWIADKLKLCEQQGYIDVAFGLRIRTPIVGKTVLGTSKTPYMATAEARSVGNAISGQSYCQLTNRAVNEFMERVWVSEYKYDILPVCLIHDAIYLMVKNDVAVVEWVNNNLIECMQWQELDEIKHDVVKLEAELDVYYPSWANAITLPNKISQDEIIDICSESTA